MSIYWSRAIREIVPYTPGEQPQNKNLIKLNTNENPYPPSQKVLSAMHEAISGDLRLYPDPDCNKVRAAASNLYGIPCDHIFVGNGSDEILAFCFKAFFDPNDVIAFPEITYSFYEVYAKLFNLKCNKIPLTDNFDFEINCFLGLNQGIVLANPNAPTGKLLSIEEIEKIVKNNPSNIVIIDEAYIDFGGKTAIELIKKYGNLLIIQTFSKFRSLAGLRIGLAFGHADLIEGLNKVKNSFNSYTIDRIALAGAEQSLIDNEHCLRNAEKIIQTRDKISKRLKNMGFYVVDSNANFIFMSHPRIEAKRIFNELKSRGIIVRYFEKPKIDNYLRVSIGTDDEMDIFINQIHEILSTTSTS
ncbi:histidinol-phosphate transaminase [Gorillibacterium massiliense]|uniref:histidinol-phosphate transaminase n=1 Tax=Gorillibacterium massiliense TaxID=1280390 RepID=UPI0004AEB678|nr:histidinol-phosphate transaminase [Gorillibacterium massiliense]